MGTTLVKHKDKFPSEVIYDPANSVIGSDIETPDAAPVAATNVASGNLGVGTYSYKVTFVTAVGETLAGPESNEIVINTPSTAGRIDLSAIPIGPTGTTSRKVYRTARDGHVFKLLTTIADNTTTTYADNVADSSLGAVEPASPATSNNYSLIANGPFMLQVDTIAGGTTAKVEMKIHGKAEWVQLGADLTSANTPHVGIFDGARPNYVRVRRSAGAGNFRAYCQV